MTTNNTKFYPGPDSSTWPPSGSLWKWCGANRLSVGDSWAGDAVADVCLGDLVFLAEVVYCTKSEITCNLIFGEKVIIWTFPCSMWNHYFERAL